MTWTAIYIEKTDANAKYHWVYLCNDDNMDGKPDGRITVTQGFGPLDDVLKLFGNSRMYQGREISVFVNGVRQI